jgi:outer membrane protein OmpA-like peptidoglycan-associated protein
MYGKIGGLKMRKLIVVIFPVVALLFTFSFTGCAKKTTFVLLPDPDGRVGELAVTTDKGTRIVSKADHATQVSSAQELPSKPEKMTEEAIQEKFGMALAADPGQPAAFSLYFKSGTNQLTAASSSLLPDILAAIISRKSKDISVVGHTDRVGAEDLNFRLSRKRADAIKSLLVSKGVESNLIHVDAHGESNPLIATADEVAEPKNRRVDVTVR